MKVRTVLIGYGHWGKNLARVLMESADFDLIGVVDPIFEARLKFSAKYGSQVPLFADLEAANAKLPAYDLAVIATPPRSHFELARQSLMHGAHCLVEKPTTLHPSDTEHLLFLARTTGKRVFTDFTFVYTDSVKYIKEAMDRGDFGRLLYYSSSRLSLGRIVPDTDVIGDLAAHDLSILTLMNPGRTGTLSAVGTDPLGVGQNCIASINIKYHNGASAHMVVSWISPMKDRRVIFGCADKMIIYDENNVLEKVKVYDSGIDLPSSGTVAPEVSQYIYRTGNVLIPSLESREALVREVEQIASVLGGSSSGTIGGEILTRDVSMLLAAAWESQEKGGAPVPFNLET